MSTSSTITNYLKVYSASVLTHFLAEKWLHNWDRLNLVLGTRNAEQNSV